MFQSHDEGRPRTSGTMFKRRHLSSSTPSKPHRYEENINNYSEMYPYEEKTKNNLRDEFLESTIKKIQIRRKEEAKVEDPEMMSVKMYRQFPASKRKRNRSTL